MGYRLAYLACLSLKHLDVEAPATGRLAATTCIARFVRLESLVVTVSDVGGRCIAFPRLFPSSAGVNLRLIE